MTKKVAVALSGGVDSAVTTLLLKNQGYEVVGITGRMLSCADFEEVVQNAKNVADKLKIEHYSVDLSEDFQNYVVDYFQQSYKNGATPNPCIMCNKYIKWGALMDYAFNELGADYIATGHYAKIIERDGFYKLYPAEDTEKDQLYFLFALTQKQLSKTLFPLSELKKEEVKKLALKYDLPPKSAKESQDICFIKAPMTTKKYLNNLFEANKGDFVEKKSGKIVGHHDGFWQYTIGQRKGIGLAAPEALYVTGIDSETNTVYVGYRDELFTNSIMLNNLSFSYPFDKTEFEGLVKVRYNMKSVKSKIQKVEDGWEIDFETHVSAITRGQACVIYDINDGHLIAGGWI